MIEKVHLLYALYRSRDKQSRIKDQQEGILKVIKEEFEKRFDFSFEEFKSKVIENLRSLKDEHKTIYDEISDATKAIKEVNKAGGKLTENLPQATNSKMHLIIERTLEFVEKNDSSIDKILEGRYPVNFSNDTTYYTFAPFNEIPRDDKFYGSVKVDIMNTLLLVILNLLNPERYKEIEKTALCHEATPVVARDGMENSLFFSTNARTWRPCELGERKLYFMTAVNGGYTFGGVRRENQHWTEDHRDSPEDCSSLVGKSVGESDQWITSSLLEFAKSSLHAATFQEFLQPISESEAQMCDIWIKRSHCGILTWWGRGSDSCSFSMVHAARNIEDYNIDGIGISGCIRTDRFTSADEVHYFRVKKLGKHAGHGTFLSDLRDSDDSFNSVNTDLSGVTIEGLCKWIDYKMSV